MVEKEPTIDEIRREAERGYPADPPSTANDHVLLLLRTIDAIGKVVWPLVHLHPYNRVLVDPCTDEVEDICHFCNDTYPKHAEECAWVVAQQMFQRS